MKVCNSCEVRLIRDKERAEAGKKPAIDKDLEEFCVCVCGCWFMKRSGLKKHLEATQKDVTRTHYEHILRRGL